MRVKGYITVLVNVLSIDIILAQTFDEMGMPKKPKPAPLDKDLPYIRCGVCKRALERAHHIVEELVANNKPAPTKKRRFEASATAGNLEGKVEDAIAALCNPDSDAGAWISELDIAKSGSELSLIHKGPGHCRRECRTIAKSCESIMEKLADGDVDIAERLIGAVREGTSAQKVVHGTICTKVTGACKKGKALKWPEGMARMNEEFKPKDPEQAQKDRELEKLLATMQSGPGGDSGLSMMRPSDLDFGGGDEDVLKEEL